MAAIKILVAGESWVTAACPEPFLTWLGYELLWDKPFDGSLDKPERRPRFGRAVSRR